jgi:DNA-binding MarR family transcriptional regulator
MIAAVPGSRRQQRMPTVLLELAVANSLASELFVRELKREGYPFTHVGLLTLIDLYGPITPSDLEAETAIPKTTLRGRLQGLYQRGYVRRRPNADDRRSHFVEVTPKGQKFLEAMGPILETTERVIETELGTPLEDYRASLERLRLAERRLLDRDV